MDTETLLGFTVINNAPTDWSVRFDGSIMDPDGNEYTAEDILEAIADVRESVKALDQLEALVKWSQTVPK